jgi:hypothetical protein
MAVPIDIGTAMLLSKACLGDEAASKMDDQAAALFFAWQNHLRVLTESEAARKAFVAACDEPASAMGELRPRSGTVRWRYGLSRQCLPPTDSLFSESASIS